MISKKKNEDAVSPVIGVMLMLVVTVVIAAVVVTFSTGLAGSTGTTPTALFEVSGMDTRTLKYGEQLDVLNIRHKGGDVIPLSDLEITLENIGGLNSGLIRVFTASDSATSMDYSTAKWEEAGSSHQSIYAQATNGLKNTQEQYDSLLEQLGLPADTKPSMDICFDYGAFEYMDLIMNREQWEFYIEDIENYFSAGLEVDSSGNLVGGMVGFSNGYPISVLGQSQPTKSQVSTGDIIHINVISGDGINSVIPAGTAVKWTISYIPTNSVIAKGEFEVIAD